ncbi:MAG TPA: hypothetical protein VGK67_33520 [Myxococcales bacterium]|jgi:hypothetical protein
MRSKILSLAVALLAVQLGATPALAEEPPAAPPAESAAPLLPVPPPLPAPETPAVLLERANEAVDAGRTEEARGLFERVVAESPTSVEAQSARRALKLMGSRKIEPAQATPLQPLRVTSPEPAQAGPAPDEIVFRKEPFSLRTKERLRISVWEKIDFGMTAFLYGFSVGGSYSLGLQSNDTGAIVTPMVIGALSYTGLGLLWLLVTDPDRGDLPLVLAISSYVPTTATLAVTAFAQNPDAKAVGFAAGIAGLAAVPIAALLASKLDLDPGDTQLVRDAGFWGMAVGLGSLLAFGGKDISYGGPYTFHQSPTGQEVAAGGLIGLYAGLGLGLLGAYLGDPSLERVRVATWGGYGGTLVGALVGLSTKGSQDIFRGMVVGGIAGLVLAYALSYSLDQIPPEAALVADGPGRPYSTTLVPVTLTDSRGNPSLGAGISMVLP